MELFLGFLERSILQFHITVYKSAFTSPGQYPQLEDFSFLRRKPHAIFVPEIALVVARKYLRSCIYAGMTALIVGVVLTVIIMQLSISRIERQGIPFLKHNASSRNSRIGCEAYSISVPRLVQEMSLFLYLFSHFINISPQVVHIFIKFCVSCQRSP